METRTKVTCLYTKSNTWKTKFPYLSDFQAETTQGSKFQVQLQIKSPRSIAEEE